MRAQNRHGFTLIEISIVLVIIGLVVGGVLVGRDLIRVAELRATVSQFEKYNTAALIFRNKYYGLPGDFSNAARFGLAATSQDTDTGLGNGNGLMESSCVTVTGAQGETFLFWTHLSQANLIGDATNSIMDYACNASDVTITDAVLPLAKMGRGNRFVVTSVAGRNFFMLFAPVLGLATGDYTAHHNITPQDAFYLDSKLDDGNPTTGTVISILDGIPDAPQGGENDPAIGDCYDNDDTPTVYATASSAVANSPACELRIKAGF